ncbi:MAG: choice-of-anchor tandem repeat GloVer-containing protein, partial [Limisphaerales bacterium]
NGSGFTVLHNFTAVNSNSFTNSDGRYPHGGLLLSSNTLYGTATGGGSLGYGTVFALNTNGTGFTTLYSFANGSDGSHPYAGLLLSGNTLYGTAYQGGGGLGYGTVFALNTNGSDFTTLHSFTNGSDGFQPSAGLIISGGVLYGTTEAGTVFALNTNGTGFTTLYSFTNVGDGHSPECELVISGGTLYGTTYQGGAHDYGTVFALTLTNSAANSNCLQVQCPSNIVVTACTNIQEFYAPTVTDLACSNWTVVLTPPSGSSFAPGTVTTVECAVTDCCGYSNNCSFTVTVVCAGSAYGQNIIQNGNFCLGNTNFNSDYQYVAYDYTDYTQTPQVVEGHYTVGPYVPPSYGDWAPFQTVSGGCTQMLIANGAADASESVWDQIVTVLPNTTYTISFYLAEISNPAIVADIAVVLGTNQIGTATAPSVIDTWQQYSFTWNSGTNTTALLALKDLQTVDTENDFAIANLSMSETPPQLAIILSGASVILTWPTNAAGFTLQSITNLAPPAVWSTVSPAPAIVNGQFAVTNSISAREIFYRLSQ